LISFCDEIAALFVLFNAAGISLARIDIEFHVPANMLRIWGIIAGACPEKAF